MYCSCIHNVVHGLFVHYSHGHDLLPYLTAAFTLSLELQGHCSDQLTLICRHSDIGTPPLWIHNGTLRTRAVTAHQQAAVCPQTVHVVLCACVHVCLMDQLTLTTVDYTAVTLHVAIATNTYIRSLWRCCMLFLQVSSLPPHPPWWHCGL